MTNTKRYSIVANPASGRLPINQRYLSLKQAAGMLRAQIYGLDTGCAEELAQCARERAEKCDVLVVAGGDGTFSLIVNAVDRFSFAVLPGRLKLKY